MLWESVLDIVETLQPSVQEYLFLISQHSKDFWVGVSVLPTNAKKKSNDLLPGLLLHPDH